MTRTWLDATLIPAEIRPPAGETARLEALLRYQILDTPREPEFDDITLLAARICETPMAAMTLVDADRSWLKSRLGIDASEFPRDLTFCAHAIAGDDLFVVPDAEADPRFATNPLVTGEPRLRFYAGTPLLTSEGHVLGTLCALDGVPRTLTPEQADGLRALGRQAVARLELRRKVLELEQASTYVTLLQEVAVAANEASSLAEALQAALDCICSGTGWPVGHVYVPAHDGTGDVVPSDLWHVRDDSFEPFQRATAATRLPLGVGLPGKTMVTQRPEWITVADCNERTFPRRPAAEAVGIESGLATPVLADGEVAAVLEFFSVTARQPDAALLEVLGAVGRQLGRVCERKRADQELERLAAIVDSSGDAIVGLGIDGTVANWNAAAEALTGFGSTEMIGRHIARVIATERRGDLVDILAKLEGGEPVLNFETSLTTKAGKAADVWLSVSLIVDAAGMPTGISATVRDVTARMEAERRLRETESRYRTLVEQLPLAVYTYALDAEHRPLYRSPQIESMLGYSTDEWLADPHLFTKLLHPGDRDRVIASVQHADAHGEPFADEFRLIARDDRVVWVRDEHVTIRDEAGRPQHCQGYMLDVTAAKEAEERRRETEVRFRTLAEQLPLTTYIDAPDASGNTYVSPQIEAMSGYPSSDWLGDSSLFAKLLHPEDRDHVLAAIAESAEAAAPLSHEYRLIARDGRTVWLRDSAVTVPDSEGRPSYRQGYAVDITAAKEAEELLRQTEAKYRALVEQLPLATYVVEPGENWGTDGSPELERLVYISPQIERLVGYTAEEWISDPEIFWKTLHPDDVESVRAEHAVAFREHTPLALEYRLVHRDGRAVWIQDEMVMRRDEDGTPLYAQGYLLDVTERRSGEQRLREAEARFRTLVEQIPLAIYIDALDEHSSAIYMSPQIETMVGYSPEEWLADPELFPRLLHPDDRERVMAEVERTQSTGDAFRVEYRLIAKDGRSVWIRDEDVTIRDEDGTGLYAQGYMLDITERKASEERLRDSEERTRLLFDTALDAVVTMDASGTIIGWNAQSEATFGWSAEEAVGRRLADTIVPPEYRIAHERGLARFLATGKGTLLNQRIEITALHRDGQEFPVELAITPLERGGTYEFSAFLRDISERKRAEAERDRLLEAERAQTERLRELDRLKDEFVALVSHELRTPLTSIRGYLELVLEGETGPLTDDQARFLGVVERNAARLQHLVGDLLFIAQVEAGRLTLSWSQVDMTEVARESVEAARPAAEAKGISLVLDTDAPEALVGDRARLGQLLDNFVSNAVKFTTEGGLVRVSARQCGDCTVLTVSDSGMGIPADEQARLFERFFRSSSASEQAIPGTGLGLAISKAIVEAHGGSVAYESTEGVGTTFTVELPNRPGGELDGTDRPEAAP